MPDLFEPLIKTSESVGFRSVARYEVLRKCSSRDETTEVDCEEEPGMLEGSRALGLSVMITVDKEDAEDTL